MNSQQLTELEERGYNECGKPYPVFMGLRTNTEYLAYLKGYCRKLYESDSQSKLSTNIG